MMLDRIVIIGAGRTTESILPRLCSMAPTLVLETSSETLEALRSPDPPEDPSVEVFPVSRMLADGTSRFVLEEARGDEREAVGVVAATADDRKNIEISKLCRELGYQSVVGIVIDPKAAPDYEAAGARPIVRATILSSVVERTLRHDGLVTATTVGQGRGEIVEIHVLPGSPAIGVPLSYLRAEGWSVAAIYRDGELILPAGETALQAEDRVLIIGDPAILPGIAEQLRIGVPMFPLPHGTRIVVYLPGGRDRAIEAEAEALTLRTKARSLVRVYPGAAPQKTLVDGAPDSSEPMPHRRSKTFEDAALTGRSLAEHAEQLRRLRPGLLVAKSVPRSIWARLLGRSGAAAALCNAVECPVLFPRGAPRFARVVHALIQGIADLPLADAAIDLARMLSLPLAVIRVTPPDFFGAPDPDADRVAGLIETRTSLYGLHAETVMLTGNPVKELIAAAKESDLLVVGRMRTTRDSFTTPDIALRVARAAACSVLVKTVGA